jgi:hypothetical protein
MSGVDTYRGINFQSAVALIRALELLEDPALGAALRVEGLDDIADIETIDRHGAARQTIQAKSRTEPKTWARSEIVEILARWNGQGDGFEFITDGFLGPTGVVVRQALSDLADLGTAVPSREINDLVADVARAESKDEVARSAHTVARFLDLVRDKLSRCRVSSRVGTAESLLERCEYRLLQLLQRQRPGVSVEDCTAAITRLWREITLAAGRSDPHDRTLTREQLAESCGLDLGLLDRAPRWTSQTVEGLLERAAASQPVAVPVRLRPFSSAPLALRGEKQDPLSNELVGINDLPRTGGMLFVGPTGSGKSTACVELIRLRAAEDVFGVVVDDRSYVPGQLLASVADIVAATCGVRPLETQVTDLLRDPAAILIIDGASELDSETRDQLRGELRAIRRAGLLCQLAVAGRDIATLRGLVTPDTLAFWPDAWTREDRIQLARAQGADIPSAVAHVDRIDQILGAAGSSPLLTTMALNVYASGQEPQTRAELYAAFLEGLAARAGADDTEILFGWLGTAFAHFLQHGRRQAGRLIWSRTMAETVQTLSDSGIDPGQDPTSALNEAMRIGILVRPQPFMAIGALHDSFGDYLAAAAALHHLAASPDPALPSQQEQVIFLCEMDGITKELVERAAIAAPLMAVRIGALDFRPKTDRDEHEARSILQILVAGTILAEVATVPIQFNRRGSYIHVSWSVGPRETAVLVPAGRGPLAVAVAIWGSLLRDAMRPAPIRQRPLYARTASEGAELLADHHRATQRELTRMIDELIPEAARPAITAALPQSGLSATVYEDKSVTNLGDRLNVAYTLIPGGAIIVSATTGRPDPERLDQGRTSLSSFLGKDPTAAAAETFATVLARETDGNWPR